MQLQWTEWPLKQYNNYWESGTRISKRSGQNSVFFAFLLLQEYCITYRSDSKGHLKHTDTNSGTLLQRTGRTLLQLIFSYKYFMMFLCSGHVPEGCWREKRRDRGIHLWLWVRSTNTARPQTLQSLSHKAQMSRTLYGKWRTEIFPECGFNKSVCYKRVGRGNI